MKLFNYFLQLAVLSICAFVSAGGSVQKVSNIAVLPTPPAQNVYRTPPSAFGGVFFRTDSLIVYESGAAGGVTAAAEMLRPGHLVCREMLTASIRPAPLSKFIRAESTQPFYTRRIEFVYV